jgi:uncharacterized protein YjgD (DUF1641 family)
LDDTLAMATDIADEWIRETLGGDGVGGTLASLAPRLLKSASLTAELDDVVASIGEAVRDPAKRVGPLGLLSALRDPDS